MNFTNYVARTMFIASLICLACIVLYGGLALTNSPEAWGYNSYFHPLYLLLLLNNGVGFLLFGFIPTLIGLSLTLFYYSQIKQTSKHAHWGWLVSSLFNLSGPVILCGTFEGLPEGWVDVAFFVWVTIAFFLSLTALACSLNNSNKLRRKKTSCCVSRAFKYH